MTGPRRRETTIDAKLIQDSDTALELRNCVFEISNSPHIIVNGTAEGLLGLERGEVVTFSEDMAMASPYPDPDSDGLWANKPFIIVEVERHLGPTSFATSFVAVSTSLGIPPRAGIEVKNPTVVVWKGSGSNFDWAEGGVAVCAETGHQRFINVIPDGADGSIVAWQDMRGASPAIYAQKLDAEGAPQWAPGGVVVCAVADGPYSPGQYSPKSYYYTGKYIVSDGSGGAIITWVDNRNGSYDSFHIYSQRISSDGETLWADGGVEICTAVYKQNTPRIVSDGAGGGIIVWEDYRGGTGLPSDLCYVYAQRVGSDGLVKWDPDGVAAYSSEASQPSATSDGSGGVIIVTNGPTTYVSSQRLNSEGEAQWGVDGVPIMALENISGFYPLPDICSDYLGGAFMVWQDHRRVTTPPALQIYAQRINSSGEPQWETNGILVSVGVTSSSSPAGCQVYPAIIPDDAGGAFISFFDYGDYDFGVQRINSSGAPLWGSFGTHLCNGRYPKSSWWQASLAPDGAGGVFIAWRENRYADVVIQHVDARGVLTLGPGGENASLENGGIEAVLCQSSDGWVTVYWESIRNDPSGGTSDLYAQKFRRVPAEARVQMLNIAGIEEFPHGGTYLGAVEYGASLPVPFVDLFEQPRVVYSREDGTIRNVKLSDNGSVLWDVEVSNPKTGCTKGTAVSNSVGEIITAFYGITCHSIEGIYCQKTDSSGETQWDNPIPIVEFDRGEAEYLLENGEFKACQDWADGAVVVWSEKNYVSREDNSMRIKAQRVSSMGAVWPEGGIDITQSGIDRDVVSSVCSIADVGTFICFTRKVSGSGNSSARISLVDNSGEVLSEAEVWGSGSPGAPGGGVDVGNVYCTSEDGKIIVAWDYYDYLAAKRMVSMMAFDSQLTKLWGAVAQLYTAGEFSNVYVDGVSPYFGGALVLYHTVTAGGEESALRVAKVSAANSFIGFDVLSATTPQGNPSASVASDAKGGVVISWSEAGEVLAQHIDGSGSVVWSGGGISLWDEGGDSNNSKITGIDN